MNKRQKEVEHAKLTDEEKELNHLKAIYSKASEDIQKKIRISDGKITFLLSEFNNLDDEQKSILQSQIYQKQFQESLKKQIDSFTKDLNSGQYKSINEYLKSCYETGYIGTMYDIAGQGVPLILPIDQKAVTKAMTHDTKLSTSLYKRLGVDVNLLKKRIANNISRGIATASEYSVIARNIGLDHKVGFNRAMRIARTEGHRIQVLSAVDAQHDAKDAGADVVKQWDAALDGKTRPHHKQLDGQIRELDEPFEVDGMEVMHPSGFGRASEDVNCRCALLQRARWALDDEELETLKERAKYFGLDKTKDFEDYRKKYLKAVESSDNGGKMDVQSELQAIKDRLNGKPASVEDLKEAGQVVKKHIGEYHMTDAEKEYNKAYENIQNMSALIRQGKMSAASTEYGKAYKKWKDAEKNVQNLEKTHAKWLSDALSEIRQMGSNGIESEVVKHLKSSRSATRKYVEDAYSFYPREWIEKSIARGKLTPKSAKRGYYSDRDKEIAISGAGGSAFQTAMHELGHRFERVIPEIRDAEEEFYNHRTKGEQLQWLGAGYRKTEETRRDNFVKPYMGKDYGGSSYELVSMGFEYAFTHPEVLAKDPEMEAWIYGILALY